MSEPVLLVERDAGITVLTLNRPEVRNAVNVELTDRLGVALEAADEDDDVDVVIVTGAGDRAFCSGNDLREHGSGVAPPRRPEWGFAGMARHVISKPVIAAVNGAAYGGGAELVLCTDLVVAADHATFAFPEVQRGRIAGAGGLVRLPRQIPQRVALELVLTGRVMMAEEAARWGLVNRVVASHHLFEATFELAQAIAANAPLAVRATKRVMYGIVDGRMAGGEQTWEINERERLEVGRTRDAAEGAAAFLEKRPPRWQRR